MNTEKKKLPLWARCLLGLVILGLVACAWEFASSQNPYVLPVKRALLYDVLKLDPISPARETAGLAEGYAVQCYANGAPVSGFDHQADRKVVYTDGEITRLVNYSDGYLLDFPAGTAFDFTLSPLFTRAEGEGFDATVSRETATYESLKDVVTFELSTFLPFLFHDETVPAYVEHYQYRFLLSEDWQQNNRVDVERWTGENGTDFLSAVLREPGEADYDGYLYATVYTGSREYLRVMCRFDSENTALRDALAAAIDSMTVFAPTGEGVYSTDYQLALPDSWSEETAQLFQDIAGGDRLRWGIFTQDIFQTGIRETVPALEEELDYTFDVILAYLHFNMDFPTEFMEENRQNGRIVELTWQITTNNNEDMFARSPLLDIYRGELDGEIRDFARQAAEWGHPFLFRLNNEMNSDWTSYGGVVNLADPQIFVSVWQRIYRIFEEEGVDNCIWIFNPNDRSAPPSRWNDSLAYCPGDEYFQLLGVTGYNNGTYYTQWAEEWREFDVIYDEIEALYSPHFSQYPWIITEFASSSIGGDKVAWIDDMFDHIGDYPNLKIAVWFSYADFDGDTPARPYWLDETPETLAAFRDGLARTQP